MFKNDISKESYLDDINHKNFDRVVEDLYACIKSEIEISFTKEDVKKYLLLAIEKLREN
jgi:hypothetical protein